jgi:hypothetical protein
VSAKESIIGFGSCCRRTELYKQFLVSELKLKLSTIEQKYVMLTVKGAEQNEDDIAGITSAVLLLSMFLMLTSRLVASLSLFGTSLC